MSKSIRNVPTRAAPWILLSRDGGQRVLDRGDESLEAELSSMSERRSRTQKRHQFVSRDQGSYR